MSTEVIEVETACILWEGGTNSAGYGNVFIKGLPRRDGLRPRKWGLKHRIVYEEHFGPIPQGMEVCHRCDNPRCINPDHLFLGTHRENILDAYKKGRLPKIPPMPGTLNPGAKLGEPEVLIIRERYQSGVLQRELAAQFGIRQTQVSRIVRRESWKHI